MNKIIRKGDLRAKSKSKESENGKVKPQEDSQPQDERPHRSKNDEADLNEINYGDWLDLNLNEPNSLAAKHAVIGKKFACSKTRSFWTKVCLRQTIFG